MDNAMECNVKLPSRGVFYDFDCDELVIKSLTTADEQKIFGSSSAKTIDNVLSSCIVEPIMDINQLIPADKHAVMIKVRILTYGDQYKQNIYCPLCGHESEVEFSLNDIVIHEMPENIHVPLRIKLPNKDIVELKVLNCKQLDNIRARAEKVAKNTNAPVGETQFFLRLVKRIATVNGEELDMFEAEKYARNLSPRDRAYIDSAFKAIKLGYEGTVEVECPHCSKVITVPFEITGEFFNPSCSVEFL